MRITAKFRLLESIGLASILLLAGVASGCADEEHYCDDTGCYRCDGLGCRSVEPPERASCSGDWECSSGTSCTNLGCVAQCSQDQDCPDGSVCRSLDGGGGMCLGPSESDPELRPGTCERNADCGDPTLICRDGTCQRDDGDDGACGDASCSCMKDEDCGDGALCLDAECRSESDVCQFNAECGEGRVCVDGRCNARCSEDMDCPTGQQCSSEGICRDLPRPTGECTANEDCGEGGVCIDSTCYDACSGKDECGEGRYCEGGVCRIDHRPDPFCTSGSDCREGHPCIDGACRTPCETHDDCRRFDVQFNYCLDGFCATSNEATSDCRTSDDCEGEAECIDGVCR